MKFSKRLVYGVLAMLLTSVVACSENDDAGWQPGEADAENCQGVYFPSQQTAFTLDPADPTTLTFTASRVKYETEITVPVEVVASEEGVFTVSDIHFDEGQTETSFTVSFPNAATGVTYTCSIAAVGNDYVSIYSSNPSELSLSVTRVAWLDVDADKSIVYDGDTYTGYEWYTEDVMTALFTFTPPIGSYPVKVQVRGDSIDEDYPNGPNGLAGIYRMVNPYGPNTPFGSPSMGASFPAEDTYIIINAENVNEVYIDMQKMGIDLGYGACYIYSLAADYLGAGMSGAGYYGKIEAGTITFPTRSLLFAMAGYNNGGFYYGNPNGGFRLVICQDQEVDYSLLLSAAEPVNGVVDIAATLGRDVAKVKYAFFESEITEKQAEEYSEGMADGTYETKEITETGTIAAQLEATGKYTIVANIYDEANTLKGYEMLSFGYIAADDEVPVVLTAKTELTSQYEAEGITVKNAFRAIIYGEGVESGYWGVFETEKLGNDLAAQVKEDGEEFSAEQLEAVNGTGWSQMVTGLNEGTSYTLVVWAYNGYVSKVLTVEQTTDGDPDPLQIKYYAEDLLETGYAKADWLKTWNYYAVDAYDDSGNTNRQLIGQVVISENEADSEEIDYINISGLGGGLESALTGGDGPFVAEYEQELVYLSCGHYFGMYANAYYVTNRFTAEESTSVYNAPYALVGGKVADGMIAFVPYPPYIQQGLTFTGIFFGAYQTYDAEGGTFSDLAGGLGHYQWLLLVDPALDGTAGEVEAAVKRASLQPTNYVELRGPALVRALLNRDEWPAGRTFETRTVEMPALGAADAKVSFTPGAAQPQIGSRTLKKAGAERATLR